MSNFQIAKKIINHQICRPVAALSPYRASLSDQPELHAHNLSIPARTKGNKLLVNSSKKKNKPFVSSNKHQGNNVLSVPANQGVMLLISRKRVGLCSRTRN